MEKLILIIHIMVTLLLVLLVLVQQGKGAQAASFGGVSKTLFGSVGSSGFLYRATTILGITFFVTSLLLGYFAKRELTRDPLAQLEQQASVTQNEAEVVEKEISKITK